jgi:hypothetical protein
MFRYPIFLGLTIFLASRIYQSIGKLQDGQKSFKTAIKDDQLVKYPSFTICPMEKEGNVVG